jgi:predicted ester cyclase
MPAEQTKAVVRHYFEEIHKRNIEVLDELLAPNYVDHTPLPFPVPPGREGTIQTANAALRATPDGWHHLTAQVADGDLVLTMIDAGGTFEQDLFDIHATGKPITMSGMALHRVNDGRLVEHWAISDFAGLFQQIGLMPGPPTAEPAPTPPVPPARSGRPPTREEADRLIERFGAIFNGPNFNIADEILAPDYYAHFVGMPPTTTRESWKGMVRGFLAGFSEFRLTPQHWLYDGEWSGGHWTWTAKHTGEFMGIPPTGKSVEVRGLGVFRILDERLVEEHVIEDIMALLVQLGVVPAPGEQAASVP